mmetsp:Transcript_55882/g.122707  ORF Transcript_55882/g.122707 Transcript_55882/m.122707 type:complete len:324 (+) Transcript_55882:3-974(+)
MAPCVLARPSSASKSPLFTARSSAPVEVKAEVLVVHLALGPTLRRHPWLQEFAQGARLRRAMLPCAEAGCELGSTGQLVTEALKAQRSSAFTQVALRLEGVLDAGSHLCGLAILVEDDVQRQCQVRWPALAQTHANSLAAPVEVLVEAHKLREQVGDCFPGDALGCLRLPLRLRRSLHCRSAGSRLPSESRGAGEALQRGQQRTLLDVAHLKEVDSEETPRVGRQVALGGMTNTAVFGPALHEEDERLGTGLNLPALREERRIVERGGAVHREVDGDGLVIDSERGWCEQCDLGLLATESRAAELEAACRDEAVGASPDGGLL